MKLVVTGAAGGLGKAVCRRLEAEGVDYLPTDRVAGDEGSKVEIADLLERGAARRLLRGATAVLHLANYAHWRLEEADVLLSENVSMNMNVFQAAVDCGLKRIVFASTIQAVSGELPDEDRSKQTVVFPYVPLDSDTPLQPRNAYSLSKALSERMLDYFVENHGIDCVSIRFPWLITEELLVSAPSLMAESRNPYDAFAYLPMDSAADLAWRCVEADLPGHRKYFPAARKPLVDVAIRDVIRSLPERVEVKTDPAQMESLVDCAVIERETGWLRP